MEGEGGTYKEKKEESGVEGGSEKGREWDGGGR